MIDGWPRRDAFRDLLMRLALQARRSDIFPLPHLAGSRRIHMGAARDSVGVRSRLERAGSNAVSVGRVFIDFRWYSLVFLAIR